MTVSAASAIATPTSPAAVKATQNKINTALAQSGATGPKGFLLWVKAAWPKSISAPILAAARQHAAKSAVAAAGSPATAATSAAKIATLSGFRGGGGRIVGNRTSFSGLGASVARARQARAIITSANRRASRSGVGSFGSWNGGQVRAGLGDTGTTGFGGAAVMTPLTIGSTGSTAAIASAPSGSASNSWASDVGTAVNSAIGAYVGVTQAQDAQTLFETNLTRAQQGLAPIGANPSAVGIIPTASTMISLGPILLIGGGLLALALVMGGGKSASK